MKKKKVRGDRSIRPDSPNNAKKQRDFNIDRFNKKINISLVIL